MAISALHQALFHLVVERHVELRLGIRVALEAKLRLLNLQQLLRSLAVMNAVAAQAAHIVLAMGRAFEIRVLPLVAAQASRIDLFGRCLRGIEYLGDIPATVDVRLARTMASFTRDARLAMHLGNSGVR